MAIRLSSAVLLVLVLLLHAPALADDELAAGHLINVEGEVRIKRSTLAGQTAVDWVEATVGMRVFPGDQLITGADGRATIEYGNRVRTHIKPGALFTVRSSSPADHRHWKQLTEDLGVMLYTDEAGVTRGRLYVLVGQKWQAVALDSPEDFLPDVLPLGR